MLNEKKFASRKVVSALLFFIDVPELGRRSPLKLLPRNARNLLWLSRLVI
jgi:hypothetical protein